MTSSSANAAKSITRSPDREPFGDTLKALLDFWAACDVAVDQLVEGGQRLFDVVEMLEERRMVSLRRHELKILDAIVVLLAVEMMDALFSSKVSTEMLLHHKTVLGDVARPIGVRVFSGTLLGVPVHVPFVAILHSNTT